MSAERRHRWPLAPLALLAHWSLEERQRAVGEKRVEVAGQQDVLGQLSSERDAMAADVPMACDPADPLRRSQLLHLAGLERRMAACGERLRAAQQALDEARVACAGAHAHVRGLDALHRVAAAEHARGSLRRQEREADDAWLSRGRSPDGQRRLAP